MRALLPLARLGLFWHGFFLGYEPPAWLGFFVLGWLGSAWLGFLTWRDHKDKDTDTNIDCAHAQGWVALLFDFIKSSNNSR